MHIYIYIQSKETWDDANSDDEERAAVEKEFNRAGAKSVVTDKRGSMGADDSDDEESVRRRMATLAIKPFLFEPCKKGSKTMQCYVVREKIGFTRSSSIYRAYLEDGNRFLFSAKVRNEPL